MKDEPARAWQILVPVRLLLPEYPVDTLFSADLHVRCGTECDRRDVLLLPPDAEPAAE